MWRARSETVWPFVRSRGTVRVYLPAFVVATAVPSSSIRTITPPSGSLCLPVTLPVITADCACARPDAATHNASSAPAQTVALNERRLIMKPPLARSSASYSRRLGRGPSSKTRVLVHALREVRNTGHTLMLSGCHDGGYIVPQAQRKTRCPLSGPGRAPLPREATRRPS